MTRRVCGRMGWRTLLWLVLLITFLAPWHNVRADDVNQQEEKDESGKGDPSCESLPEGVENALIRSKNVRSSITPCRDDLGDDDYDTDTGVNIGAPGTNYIYFDLFVALPPYQQSLGSVLKVFVTGYLNVTSFHYNFRIADQGYGQNRTSTTAPAEAPLAAWHWLLSVFDDIIGVRDVENKVADLFLVDYEPQTVLKEDLRWWWQYTLKYKCYWVDSGVPIVEPDMLLEIKANTEELLDLALQFQDLQARILQLVDQNYEFILIQLEDPRIAQGTALDTPEFGAHPFLSQAPTASPAGKRQPDLTNVADSDPFGEFDSTEWDWRRYVGLGVLLGTVSSTVCFVAVANFRRSRRIKKETWGNLATEEGVDELLRNGWKIQDGKMLIFDKKGYGYSSEDDSMLVGGFQQSELVGTEVTMMSQAPTSPHQSQRNSSSSHASPYAECI